MDPIQELRDIHLPQAIPCWPFAPGWYILLGVLILVTIISLYWYARSKRKHKVRGLALQKLAVIEKRIVDKSQATVNLQELSILLKQLALLKYPRADISSMHSKAWLEFLDKVTHSQIFTQGPGQILAEGPYKASVEPLDLALFSFLRKWIKRTF